MTDPKSVASRLLSLFDHLNLPSAHVAAQIPADIAGLVAAAPDRLASVVLCVPSRLDPAPFLPVALKVRLIAGETGQTATVAATVKGLLPGAVHHALAGYNPSGWSDVVADRRDDIVAAFDGLPWLPSADAARSAGSHAGISYTVHGEGPPLVLFPFFLAPSQWAPAIPALAQRFTVIVLGGRHLGGVALLEDRAAGTSYRTLAHTLWDRMAIGPESTILDAGCGTGALDRLLARRLSGPGRIIATDVNRFLMTEGRKLSDEEGLDRRISFHEANAERLPFPDRTFDAAFTVTVLEECNADAALRELFRVVKPGGHAGVIVRAIDMPQWWNLDLPAEIRRKADVPPPSVASHGVADASLYPRMRDAGFADLACFPSLVTADRPDSPIWRFREDHVLAQLTEAETAIWHAAARAARDRGLLFMANPMHCAVGMRPLA